MDIITIPASMTLEEGFSIKRYKWKSKEKTSTYKKKCRRAFIRFICKNLSNRVSKLEIKRQFQLSSPDQYILKIHGLLQLINILIFMKRNLDSNS